MDNDVIICVAVSCRYSSDLSNIHENGRLEPFNYHNITFKRCADVISLGRLDHFWLFRHHWFAQIGWGKNGAHSKILLDQIISVLGCFKLVLDSYFRFRLAIFQFSRALVWIYDTVYDLKYIQKKMKVIGYFFSYEMFWFLCLSASSERRQRRWRGRGKWVNPKLYLLFFYYIRSNGWGLPLAVKPKGVVIHHKKSWSLEVRI